MKRGTIDHPKTLALQVLLGASKAQTIGHLEALFHFTTCYAKNGDIGKWPNDAIAKACFWEGDPEKFVAALIEARWLDRDEEYRIVVHDWYEHAEDSVHMAVARARGYICGRPPKYGRLPKDERESAEEHYKHNPCVIRAHAVRNPGACLSPPLPSPALALPSPEICATAGAVASPAPVAETRNGAGRRQPADSISFDRETRTWSGITEADRQTWAAAAPGVDIDVELAKAANWLLGDWAHRKKTHWRRFLSGWMGRAQDRAATNGRAHLNGHASPHPYSLEALEARNAAVIARVTRKDEP